VESEGEGELTKKAKKCKISRNLEKGSEERCEEENFELRQLDVVERDWKEKAGKHFSTNKKEDFEGGKEEVGENKQERDEKSERIEEDKEEKDEKVERLEEVEEEDETLIGSDDKLREIVIELRNKVKILEKDRQEKENLKQKLKQIAKKYTLLHNLTQEKDHHFAKENALLREKLDKLEKKSNFS